MVNLRFIWFNYSCDNFRHIFVFNFLPNDLFLYIFHFFYLRLFGLPRLGFLGGLLLVGWSFTSGGRKNLISGGRKDLVGLHLDRLSSLLFWRHRSNLRRFHLRICFIVDLGRNFLLFFLELNFQVKHIVLLLHLLV